MKYYSETLKKLFDSADELTKAESEVKAKELQKKLKEEKREKDREKVEKAINDAIALMMNYIKEYGSFKFTSHSDSKDKVTPLFADAAFDELLDRFLR